MFPSVNPWSQTIANGAFTIRPRLTRSQSATSNVEHEYIVPISVKIRLYLELVSII